MAMDAINAKAKGIYWNKIYFIFLKKKKELKRCVQELKYVNKHQNQHNLIKNKK